MYIYIYTYLNIYTYCVCTYIYICICICIYLYPKKKSVQGLGAQSARVRTHFQFPALRGHSRSGLGHFSAQDGPGPPTKGPRQPKIANKDPKGVPRPAT